jgi:2,3-bisphosphoglycerate-independent phosphoglycerate mutase
VAALEEVDAGLPEFLALRPDVLAVTGDHSTPVPLRAHSWHPVPLLLHAPASGFVDEATEFTEAAAARGTLGTFPARELMGLLLAHAGRLSKYGA